MSLKTFISGAALKSMGWKVEGELPPSKRNVVIAAPHTSMHDFKFGVLAAMKLGIKASFLIKKELFWFPLGSILRALGGIPVDRASKTNTVDKIAELINQSEYFYLAMSPEGTRSKVDRWGSGFYYIALAAKVPIIIGALDYGKKTIRLCTTTQPTGNYEADMKIIMACYADVVPKYPEKFQLI